MRKTIPQITAMKGQEKIAVLTAYTYPLAAIIDEYVDIILVGDSLGMVLYGMDSTLPVSVKMMINHGSAVIRGSNSALVVVDMPFGSYQESPAQSFRNAAKIISQTGCQAVKLEGGVEISESVHLLVNAGIPVMGHIGLKPQSFNTYGGFKVQGKDEDSANKIMEDARALQDAGCFSIVVEGVKESLAKEITQALEIPVIGIGASPDCDGQVLVSEDMLGLAAPNSKSPKFVKKFGSLNEEISAAVKQYARDVKNKTFPTSENCY
ncbi:MAG: 3-methyl-2-oxobutanoate hydroxymethyltransferase [Alphaproteobacteria bacterium CG11_big_fil_rev_8_21_14_0_20_44_7]|nr:MAG: 3-methyl-2-oxobutanoate hydroxymethyltransferase [Alphaproteobacteria bacterium CG11_big_fil_rev_8_21_14_0_20_44_7]